LRVFGYLLAFVTINGSYGHCHRHVVIELPKPSPLSDVVDSSSTVEDLVQQYVHHRLADREHKNALVLGLPGPIVSNAAATTATVMTGAMTTAMTGVTTTATAAMETETASP